MFIFLEVVKCDYVCIIDVYYVFVEIKFEECNVDEFVWVLVCYFIVENFVFILVLEYYIFGGLE